ncbi:MAG: helix-turn-helix domain-containing protein [Oscillospiraceae bacterium]|nr:helix-turn-helix domain-containing protein [Oscillospiraceae bacterium]
MPIKYKIDVLAALKAAGYSSYRLRKEKIIGERTIQKIRNGEIVTAETLALICKLLQCQPGDILEYEE